MSTRSNHSGTQQTSFSLGEQSNLLDFSVNGGIGRFQNFGDVVVPLQIFGADFQQFASLGTASIAGNKVSTKINGSYVPSTTTKPYFVYWTCEMVTTAQSTIAGVSVVVDGFKITGGTTWTGETADTLLTASNIRYRSSNTTIAKPLWQTYQGSHLFNTLSNPSSVNMFVQRLSGKGNVRIRNAIVYIWRQI